MKIYSVMSQLGPTQENIRANNAIQAAEIVAKKFNKDGTYTIFTNRLVVGNVVIQNGKGY